MKKIYQLIVFLLIFLVSQTTFSSKAQVATFSQTISKRFTNQWVNEPQEKVYLQTDKPYYSAGENIWFKGYLVNAATHLPKSLSQFIYVELIDKSNAVISRVKIKKDSLGFSGIIKLKPELSTGSYVLRAYTYWMQNATTDFFFQKQIYIGNAIDDYVTSKISFGKLSDSRVPVSVTFMDAYKNPITGKNVKVLQNSNIAQNKKLSLLTDKEGKINWQFSVDSADHSTKIIEVSIDDPGYKYKNRFFPPEFNTAFDVQFFPESGPLLNNNLQAVAFKAIGPDGLSIEVTGKVYSDKNEEIAEFSSYNKGMGKFTIVADSGVNYYALVKSISTGVEKRFNLPVSQSSGLILHLVSNKGKLYYEIINNTTQPNDAYFLLIHSRGRMLITKKLTELDGHVLETLLPPGINSFSVIDSIGNTYCERLYFIPNLVSPIVTMQADKPVYGKRQLVDMSLNVQSVLGKPCDGSFSISVTDSHTVNLDSLSDNIMSSLLLTSDLNGYIEDPASYTKDNLNSTHEKTDLLMLTQGWRRFNTADVVKGVYKPSKYYLEGGQALSGKVLNVFNKPSKKCEIIMISPAKSMIRLAVTDSLGRYLIDGFEFADSTSFALKAKKTKTLGDVEIIPDLEVFPKSNVFIPIIPPRNYSVLTEYLQQSKEKYYTEGGMRVVNLEGVTVTAAKKNKNIAMHSYSGSEDAKITSEKLAENAGLSILDMLSMMPGVQVNGQEISIRGGGPPLILIDEVEVLSIDDITYLNTNDVEEISLFKGANTAIFGSRGGNGAIAISLKKGVVRQAEAPISLISITPLGYQKPSQFYVPKYDVDSVRLNSKFDLRTTIYWNPKLNVDSTGTVHLKFYTADKANNYSVVFEGITNKGEICRYVGILKREGN